MKKKILAAILVVLVLVGVGTYFFVTKNNAIPAKKVELENVVVLRSVSASGVVKSKNYAELAFSLSGRVTSLTVSEGDAVKKWQPLASVFNTDVYLDSQAKAKAVEVAKRVRDLHVENYATNLDGFGGKDEYKVELRRLTSAVEKTEAEYQSTVASLGKAYITAPFDSTVIKTDKKPGEYVSSGETVIKVADLTTLEFEVSVDQEDFGAVKEGQRVKIGLDAFAEQIDGVVLSLPQYADVSDMVGKDFAVKIGITDSKGKNIAYGMNGDAQIIIEQTETEVSAVPFDGITTDTKGSFVWIVENSKLAKLYIDKGLEGDYYTQIKSSLTQPIVTPETNKVEFVEGKKAKILQ